MIRTFIPQRGQKAVTFICAFCLPAFLALLAFAVAGVYPFGDKSLLIVDMHNEYIDYLAQLNESLWHSGSFLRSWNMGMGLNMLGLIAFYTASPFNLIVILLPLSWITETVFAATLLKIGLCGLSFAVFARYAFPNLNRALCVAFAVAYALMAYNIAYSSNIMWLDGTAFLPFVILGAEKIIRGGRYKLFFFSLVYVFFTSYYIGYMIGIFCFLYFTCSYFSENRPFKEYLHKLWRFLVAAALAACCCAFLLIPAFFNLKDGQNELWNIRSQLSLEYPAVRLAAKLLPGAYDSLTDAGLPNIYCTVLAVVTLALYFCTKAVNLREKLVFGGLLGFLVLSFSCGFLDLAWHAFEDPTWFPARYSFVFSFLVLYLGLRCFSVFGRVTRGEIALAAGFCLLLFIEIGISRFRFVNLKVLAAAFALLLLYIVLLSQMQKNPARAVAAALLCAVCLEAWGNASAMILGMDRQFEYKDRSQYREFMQEYLAGTQLIQSLDGGVYRMEIVGQRGPNGGMALGYNGISHYSSTTDQALNGFLRSLGYNRGTINELRFSPSSPATNGLLGIKYVLSPGRLGEGYELRASTGDLGVLENRLVWPLAFWSPADALEFTPVETNPFLLQNEYISALLGGGSAGAFLPVTVSEARLTNLEETTHGDHMEYTRLISGQDAEIEYIVSNPGRREIFAYFPAYNERYSASEVYVNGKFLQKDFAYRNNTVLPLGSGERISLKIIPGGERLRITGAYFAALDFEAAQNAAGLANEMQMNFSEFLDTRVEGEITAPEDGIVATTFPYDKGWRVYVDGKPVEAQRLSGVFMAIPVARGAHTVTMRYYPPGFLPGTAVSLLTVAGMLAWYGRRRGLIGKRREAPNV